MLLFENVLNLDLVEIKKCINKKTWENQLSKKPENYTSIEERAQPYKTTFILRIFFNPPKHVLSLGHKTWFYAEDKTFKLSGCFFMFLPKD